MSTIINARSPYYIKQVADTGKTLQSVELNLFIYPGLKGTDKPTTATYTLTKTPLLSVANNYVVFEISELIRDYLYTEYYNEAQDAVWVEADIDYTHTDETTGSNNIDYLAFDGFGLFNEGANPRTSTDPTQSSFTPMVLQSNRTVYFVRGQDIKIPIFSEPEPSIVTTIGSGVWNEVGVYWEETNPIWDSTSTSQSVTDSDDSDDKIQYLIIESDYATDGDTITITSTQGSSQTTVITLRELCDPKYTPIRMIFYNKYGALQDVYANKKSTSDLKIKDENYKTNTFDLASLTYSTNSPTVQRFRVQANESVNVNTDFYVEEMNEPIKQMLLSENIWLEIDGEIIPALVKDTTFKQKTHVNDKLIQYSFNFEYAFDHIQNVR